MVLEQGIIEGRKTYANMIKYIKMTASQLWKYVFGIGSLGTPSLPADGERPSNLAEPDL